MYRLSQMDACPKWIDIFEFQAHFDADHKGKSHHPPPSKRQKLENQALGSENDANLNNNPSQIHPQNQMEHNDWNGDVFRDFQDANLSSEPPKRETYTEALEI